MIADKFQNIRKIFTPIIILLLLTAIFLALILPIKYAHPVDIEIKAVGNANSQSQGSEVWVCSLNIDGKLVPLEQLSYKENEWEIREECLVSFKMQPAIATYSGKSYDFISIELVSHEYSGVVEISINGQKVTRDLYSSNGMRIFETKKYARSVFNILLSIFVYFFIFLLLLKVVIYIYKKSRIFNKRNLLLLFSFVFFIPSILMIYLVLYNAYYHSLFFDGFFANGAFQLFNPLSRISAGQIPGHDFQFFHGIGTLYLHYPLYRLFGSNLFASEFSRNVTSPMLYIISSYFLLTQLLRNHLYSLFCTLFITITGLYLLPFLLLPINSLLGVRSAFPLITIGALLLLLNYQKSKIQSFKYQLLIAFLLALSFYISTEHGIALILAFSAIYPFITKSYKCVFVTVSLIVIFILMLYFVTCGKYFMDPLKYALFSVPMDQFWYFGAPPNAFISKIGDLLIDKLIWGSYALFFPLIFVVCYYYKRSRDYCCYGIIILLLYGMFSTISQLGYLSQVNSMVFLRTELFTMIWIGGIVLPGIIKCIDKKIWNIWVIVIFAISLMPSILSGIPNMPKQFDLHITEKKDQYVIYNQYFGVYLSETWSEHLQIMGEIENKHKYDIDKSENHLVWSTYSSLIERSKGQFNPASDYIIHALGPQERKAYVETFIKIKPEFVRTTTPSWRYEGWLRNTHWNFYEQILNNYDIVGQNYNGIIWMKKAEPWHTSSSSWEEEGVKIENGKIEVYLPEKAKINQLAVINVKYNINNPWRYIPLIGKLPRFLILTEQNSIPISLPPYEKELSFPVYLKGGDDKIILSSAISPRFSGVDFQIIEVKYKIINLTAANKLFVSSKQLSSPK